MVLGSFVTVQSALVHRIGSAVATVVVTPPVPTATTYEVCAFILLTAVVLAAAVFDWRTQRIPNRLLGPAVLTGFLLAAVFGFITAGFTGMLTGLGQSGFAMLAGFVPLFLIFMAGALGGGDVKMMAAVGAIAANWEVVLGTAFYGFIAAALIAIVVMIRHRIVMRTFRRIANAALLAASKVKADLDTDTPRIPLAVGFALGAIISGIEHLLHVRLPWN